MKKLILLAMAVLLVIPQVMAQRPGRGGQGRGMGPGPMDAQKLDEMRDTIRFLRLSESRKKLNFNEDKLLMINEIFDALEELRFKTRGEEMQLRQTLIHEKASVEERVAALRELNALRQKMTTGEVETWALLEQKLTPEELLEVFVFYEKFQRDVRRRLGQLRGQGSNGGRFDRRRN